MRAAFYLRCSTDKQSVAHQRDQLTAIALQRGWEVVAEYEDAGISGAKGRDRRPSFDRLHKDMVRGRFDIVAAWSADRLGRSLIDLIGFLQEMHAAKVDLFLATQGIDTSTPAGRAMFQMLGVYSEFERSIIQERVRW